jgi:hypothetical protein
MTPTRGLRFDITGLVGEITLRECDDGHTWQCYISSLICKAAYLAVVLNGAPEQS